MQAPIFVINLDRRPDRMEQIGGALDRHGLAYTRISAVDAQTTSPAKTAPHIDASAPLGAMGAGDTCCLLSHRLVWQKIAAMTSGWAVVLEDDALLSDAFSGAVKGLEAVPAHIQLIKLERCTYNHIVLLERNEPGPAAHTVRRLLSKHACSAGYAITPQGARIALAHSERCTIPIDHLLFNPNISPMHAVLPPYQLCPAVVEQVIAAEVSDIIAARRKARKKGWAKIRRDLRRLYYETNLIPRQFLQFVGGARLTDVTIGPASGPAQKAPL